MTLPCKIFVGPDWNADFVNGALCGDTFTRRIYITNANSTATLSNARFGSFNIEDYRLMTSDLTYYGMQSQNNMDVGNTTTATAAGLVVRTKLYNSQSQPSTASGIISQLDRQLFGPLSVSNIFGWDVLMTLATNYTGNVTNYIGFGSRFTFSNSQPVYGTLFLPFREVNARNSLYQPTTQRSFTCDAGGMGVTENTCHSSVEMTGGTNNAAFHIRSNSATCGAGLVAGTAFDTCLYRGRAGAWTGPAGTDIYTDSGYICAGTGCSSVTSTNKGIYDAGVRVMSSVSCTGATCSLTNGALSVTVTGTTSATVSASITGGGSCGGSVSVLGSWSNMRVTLITGTGPGCSVPGDDVFQVVRGTACGSSGVPVCNISPGDDVSPPLTWSPSGSGTTRIARTPSYGSTLSVSTTYYYDIRCGCTTD